jgi:hypothetical protein
MTSLGPRRIDLARATLSRVRGTASLGKNVRTWQQECSRLVETPAVLLFVSVTGDIQYD